MKPGRQKRLLGTLRGLQRLWCVEHTIYENCLASAIRLRRHKADIIEVFAGKGNITARALEMNLRALQPVDKCYGIRLDSKDDFNWLRGLLDDWKPILTLLEPECRLWSPLVNMNYWWRPHELEALRNEAQVTVKETVAIIKDALSDQRFFLLENPHHGALWQQPDMLRLLEEFGHVLYYDYGHMCRYGLRGRHGGLIKKATGWLSNSRTLLQGCCKKCTCTRPHEECMGGNSTLAAVYTKSLARSIIYQFMELLRQLGDERFVSPAWPAEVDDDDIPATEVDKEADYVDLNKDTERWRPLLMEAAQRLEGKVAVSAYVKPSAFLEQIKALVPWHLELAQIYRLPKARRMPARKLLETPNITHRAAILLFQDNTISVESQALEHLPVGHMQTRFDRAVRVAIFLYGKPLSLTTAAQRRTVRVQREQEAKLPAPEDLLESWQPGAKDIQFPGIDQETVPHWMQSVLRRLHTNLGHPSNATLVRQLSQAQASTAALIGARAMKCAVCERLRSSKEPRPTKALGPAKAFNQRLVVDILYVHDLSGETHVFLNQVDDMTTYQVLTRLSSREANVLISALEDGWFQFFGAPENILADAEGGIRSSQFEDHMAYHGVAVRYIPPDAHYQLGKAERHGSIARNIMMRLIHQFGLFGAESMVLAANMATHAKNSLTRRGGASPCQWVFGRNPRLPTSLVSEGENPEAMEMNLSQQFQQIEQIRFNATQHFLELENNSALKAAMLRKSRPWRGPFQVGEKVAYWRLRNPLDAEGGQPGYRQGIILAADPGPTGSIWIRNDRGRVVQVAREQLRHLHGEEAWIPGEADFELLKRAEQDLSLKHAGQHDQRGQAPAAPGPALHDQPPAEAAELPVPDLVPRLPGQGQVQGADLPRDGDETTDTVVHDAPLDAQGQPLGNEPDTSVQAGLPVPPAVEAPAGEAMTRRASGATSSSEPDLKRLKMMPPKRMKTTPTSSPPMSRRSSVTPFPQAEEFARQTSQASQARSIQTILPADLPAVPEDDEDLEEPPPLEPLPSAGARDDTSAAQEADASSNLIVGNDTHLTSARTFCQFCGSTESWEVQRLQGQTSTSSTTGSTLQSVSVWNACEKRWSWTTLANYALDDLDEGNNDKKLDKKVVICHSARRGRRRLSPRAMKQHKNLYGHHQTTQVWLLRHGRDACSRSGWDGSPEEFQSLCQTAHVFSQASQYTEWREALARGEVEFNGNNTKVYLTYNANFQKLPETSDEEDGGLQRIQRQALKREIPWRSMPAQEVPDFVEAVVKEWSEWKKWSSCQVFTGDTSKIDRKLILPARICYKWKPMDGGSWFKAKARIVVQGFRDPHLPLLARDAPVLSKAGLVAILQWTASHNADLVNGDCKSAFLQGQPDRERPCAIYMKIPQGSIALKAIPEWSANKDLLYELHAPVYGQANAPRQWYLHVLDTLLKLGWTKHSLDPCLFLFKDSSNTVVAVLGIHVDDIIASSISDDPEILTNVEKSFAWGSAWEKNDFVFIGRRIVKAADSTITMSQSHYASEVIITKDRADPEEKLNKESLSDFRSAIGSLQWLAGTTRPDLAADASLLQRSVSELTHGDLQQANQALKYVKATADAHIKIRPFEFNDLIIVGYGDSAFANAPGNKSQGGCIITATTSKALEGEDLASLLLWRSFRHQRVLRSTLAAEAASLDRCEDESNYVGCMMGELMVPGYVAAHSAKSPFPIHPVCDARSLFDAVHRLATSFAEKRVELDIAGLRGTCRNLKWIPTEQMIADGLTKRNRQLRDKLRLWASDPFVCLKEAHLPEDDLQNNAPLRHKPTESKSSENLTVRCMSCS